MLGHAVAVHGADRLDDARPGVAGVDAPQAGDAVEHLAHMVEELLQLVLPDGGLAQARLHPLHAEREEHHQERYEDGQPGSHRDR